MLKCNLDENSGFFFAQGNFCFSLKEKHLMAGNGEEKGESTFLLLMQVGHRTDKQPHGWEESLEKE